MNRQSDSQSVKTIFRKRALKPREQIQLGLGSDVIADGNGLRNLVASAGPGVEVTLAVLRERWLEAIKKRHGDP